MIPAEFLKLIERFFDEEEQQVLVASLHQDSRILHALGRFLDLDDKQRERFTKLENWTPLYFGLIQKNDSFWKTDLSSLRVHDVQISDNEVSLDELAATNFFPEDCVALSSAASYAVEIFNLAKKRSWQDLRKSVFRGIRFNKNIGLITACLMGLFPTGEEFISTFLDNDAGIELRKTVVYALFCNVQPEKILIERLQSIIRALDEESRIEMLQFLAQIGRGDKAQTLINYEKSIEHEEENQDDRLTLKQELVALQKSNYEADISMILRDKKTAAEKLERMLENCKSLESQILEKIELLSVEETTLRDRNEKELTSTVKPYDWKKVPQLKLMAVFEKPAFTDMDRYLLDLEESIVDFPENAKVHIAAAEFYSQLGDYSRSSNHLRLAHILDPEDNMIQRKLMDLYTKNDQREAALNLSREISGKNGNFSNLEPFFQELHFLLKNGDMDILHQKLAGFLSEAQIDSIEDSHRIAEVFVEMGNYEKAIPYFEKTITAGNTDFRVWIDLYECLKKIQQEEKANRILNEAIDLFIERKGFYAALANVLLKVGEDDQGLAYIEKIKIDESEPAELADIIKFLQQQKHYQYAYDLAVKASHQYPLHAKLGIEVVRVLMENGEFERARQLLKWIQDETKDNIDYLQLSILSGLNSSVSRFPLDSKISEEDNVLDSLHEKLMRLPDDSFLKGLIDAELHFVEKDNTKAIELYKQLILTNSISKNRSEIWRAQVGLAKAMMKAGQLETAITLLTEALREKKDCLALYDLLIEAYQDANLVNEAFETARTGYAACRKDAHIIHWYIHQLTTLGKMDEVKAYFEQEQNHLQSSPSFLIEKLSFVNKYGTPLETRRILDDLQALDNLSIQDQLKMIEVSEEVKYFDNSIKNLQKISGTSFPDMERRFIEVCVYWNKGEYETARHYLEEMPASQSWEGILSAIRYVMDYAEKKRLPSLTDINQVIANARSTQDRLASLTDTTQKVLPQEWKIALQSKSIWLQMVVQNLINGQFEDNEIEQQLDIFESYADDAIIRSELAICDWMISGNADRVDWLEILSSLDEIEIIEKRETLQGMILNIMMQGGSEIAVVDELNRVESLTSTNKTLLLAKARILQKNGNLSEAEDCFLKTDEVGKVNEEIQDAAQDITAQLASFHFWRAECAFDLGQWSKASLEYFADLPHTRKMRFISTRILERILELAWKEWSYQKIGFSQNIPTVLKTKELQQLDSYLNVLTPAEKKYYQKIIAYLQDEPSIFTEAKIDEGLIACLSAFIAAIQENDMDEVVRLVNSGSYQNELALSAITLIPEDMTTVLVPVIQNGIFHDKRNVYLYVGLAKILQIQGETRLAIDALETALSLLDDEPLLQIQLASLYEEEGEIKKAIVYSEQAIKNDPQNVKVIRTHLLNLITLKNYKAAIDHYEKNRIAFENDETIIKKIVIAYYQNEQYRKALDVMKLITKDPQNDMELVLIQSKIARKLGSYPKAMQLIRRAYELNSKEPEVIIELARIKTLQENEEFGLEIIEKALESNIHSDSLILEKVKYLKEGRSEKRAVDFLEAYLEKTAEPAFTVLNLFGQMQKERGESKKAMDAYERSLKNNDCQPEIHEQVGELYMMTGNLDIAVNHFDKAIKQNPSQMDAYLQLCEVFLKRREEKRAEKIITNALQDCEEHYLIYEKAAQVYNQLGNVDKSEEYLRKATAKNPGDEKLREKLGILIASRIFENKQGND